MRAIDRRAWLREAVDLPLPAPKPARLSGMELHEAEAWLEDCERWMLASCVVNSRACQSIGSLHVAFCEWAVSNKSVPCRRDVFEELLGRVGVPCIDGFTQGLILSADLKILKQSVAR